ncbi:metalloregulator ArsR/SmtB family transcription factor [Sphingobium sp. HBC34]|uniref:Metalloregulator ArsR/SmtB family transcription factor n=1 Tax=Sphingobium cyanobacteriorum TaxID=3063954 RepID=A0ABT8ZKG6_9SPHN|nr:metalloregulator ArsR/SmtB family transcription factor [Sphingobium sp. HBC34]MDO7835018.1 metalloregulator ArsR/SmtB family transcription factor [Sphingobium sp. HBC34]
MIFKALASEPRRRILHHLLAEPMTVGEIADNFEMAMPSISRHLAILKQAGLVRERKRGQYMLYALVTDQLTGPLYDFLAPFCEQARAIVAARPRRRGRD